ELRARRGAGAVEGEARGVRARRQRGAGRRRLYCAVLDDYRHAPRPADPFTPPRRVAYAGAPLRRRTRACRCPTPNTASRSVRCAWFPYRRGEPAEPQARRWLAQALAVPEAALGLRRDAHGRPHLDPGQGGYDANWSHSGERLLVALAHGARIGADIEWLRPRPNAMTLARRFFTAGEADALAALPHDQAERWFVRLWCAKEAVL